MRVEAGHASPEWAQSGGARCVALHLNLEKPLASTVGKELVRWLEDAGVRVRLRRADAQAVERPDLGHDGLDYARGADFLIVLGGDGTLLSAARLTAGSGIPILGVNLGHIGFLTEVQLDTLWSTLPAFLAGRCVLDERVMLEATVERADGPGLTFFALNDVTVTKGPLARLVHLEVYIDGRLAASYPGDGLILSTPTGSTAYNFAAGGPVVDPRADVLLISPICPYSLLSVRTHVVDGGAVISVRAGGHARREEVMLTVDGQEGYRLSSGEHILVKKARDRVRLLRDPRWDFYTVLAQRMNAAGRPGRVSIETGAADEDPGDH